MGVSIIKFFFGGQRTESGAYISTLGEFSVALLAVWHSHCRLPSLCVRTGNWRKLAWGSA